MRGIPAPDQGGLERKHHSARGCIVDARLSVLNLVIVKNGEKDIPGLTDTTVPRCLGSKGASRTHKLSSLSTEDDVKKPLNKEGKKPRTKAPNIQHLHVSSSRNVSVLLQRNSVQRKIRERLPNRLNFWPRERRRRKKDARNRSPRDRGCLPWGFLPRSLRPLKNEIF